MSLIALDHMGASEVQLKNYYSKSVSKLEFRNTHSRDGSFNFTKAALGQQEYFEDCFNYFDDRLSRTSSENLLRELVPVLMEGVSGAAFHPMIRVSYALRNDCNSEIALSLAYWASEFLKLGNRHQQTNEELIDIRARLDMFMSDDSSLSTITDKIKVVNDTVQRAGTVIQPKKLSLDNIREYSLREFFKTNDFTLLHTVTACHAYKSISRYCESKEMSLRYLWEAILISQLSTGIKYESSLPKVPIIEMDWLNLIERAVSSTDDHVIKIVYTCWDENRANPNAMYQYVAQRAVSKSS